MKLSEFLNIMTVCSLAFSLNTAFALPGDEEEDHRGAPIQQGHNLNPQTEENVHQLLQQLAGLGFDVEGTFRQLDAYNQSLRQELEALQTQEEQRYQRKAVRRQEKFARKQEEDARQQEFERRLWELEACNHTLQIEKERLQAELQRIQSPEEQARLEFEQQQVIQRLRHEEEERQREEARQRAAEEERQRVEEAAKQRAEQEERERLIAAREKVDFLYQAVPSAVTLRDQVAEFVKEFISTGPGAGGKLWEALYKAHKLKQEGKIIEKKSSDRYTLTYFKDRLSDNYKMNEPTRMAFLELLSQVNDGKDLQQILRWEIFSRSSHATRIATKFYSAAESFVKEFKSNASMDGIGTFKDRVSQLVEEIHSKIHADWSLMLPDFEK
jgi:hypothetical protein